MGKDGVAITLLLWVLIAAPMSWLCVKADSQLQEWVKDWPNGK